jgi:hypothetical protein
MTDFQKAIAAGVALLLIVLAATSTASSSTSDPCQVGQLISERTLITPTASTFYSADALGPDIVRVGNRYVLYFSGNSAHHTLGDWRTGVATSRNPLGPFKVNPNVHLPFVNGGTIRQNGSFVTVATDWTNFDQYPWRAAVYTSGNGRDFHRTSWLPGYEKLGWRFWAADFDLVPAIDGFDAYFIGRADASHGAEIGVARFRRGAWRQFKRLLSPVAGTWDGLDLGEPAVFAAHGRTYMFYTGRNRVDGPRETGLAYSTSHGWVRCGDPLIRVTKRYPNEAIDAVPLVVGNRLYVYFGRGVGNSAVANMTGTIFVRVYALEPL